jgi:uncharacterized protein YjbI with pentapeptide repeats
MPTPQPVGSRSGALQHRHGRHKSRRFRQVISFANGVDAKLNPANLQGVNLRGANLTGADFAGAIVFNVDFRDATLTGANFSGARLDDSKLPPSIVHAKCSDTTTWPDGTRGHGTACPPPTS